jgi:hypothetical protein
MSPDGLSPPLPPPAPSHSDWLLELAALVTELDPERMSADLTLTLLPLCPTPDDIKLIRVCLLTACVYLPLSSPPGIRREG